MPTESAESHDPEELRTEFRRRLRLRTRALVLMLLVGAPMVILLLWSPGRDLASQFDEDPPCDSPAVSLFSGQPWGDWRDWRSEPEWCPAARAQTTAWAAFLTVPALWAARRWARIYRENPPPTSAEYVRLYGGRPPS